MVRVSSMYLTQAQDPALHRPQASPCAVLEAPEHFWGQAGIGIETLTWWVGITG